MLLSRGRCLRSMRRVQFSDVGRRESVLLGLGQDLLNFLLDTSEKVASGLPWSPSDGPGVIGSATAVCSSVIRLETRGQMKRCRQSRPLRVNGLTYPVVVLLQLRVREGGRLGILSELHVHQYTSDSLRQGESAMYCKGSKSVNRCRQAITLLGCRSLLSVFAALGEVVSRGSVVALLAGYRVLVYFDEQFL